MPSPSRATLFPFVLIIASLACTIGQQPPPEAVATGPAIEITDTPLPPPTPDIDTIHEFFARCPTAEEIASVDQDFSMSFEYPIASERTFYVKPSGEVVNEPDPNAGQLVCTAAAGSVDLTAIQKRAYQSVLVMRMLSFSQPLPWTSLQLYDWLVSAIDGIRLRNDIGNSFCCDPENVINIMVAENSYLAFSDVFMTSDYSGGLAYTTVLLIHEARHNEGYPHTCPENGNDNNVDEMGAWAVQYYTLQWMAQYLDPALLATATEDPGIFRQQFLDEAEHIRGRFCLTAPPANPTLNPEP